MQRERVGDDLLVDVLASGALGEQVGGGGKGRPVAPDAVGEPVVDVQQQVIVGVGVDRVVVADRPGDDLALPAG